jgi:hypothetical protein
VIDPEQSDDAHKGQGSEEGTELVAAFHDFTDERDEAGAEEVFEDEFESHGVAEEILKQA